MTFSGVYKISVLAQRQHILVAPLVFLWIIALHPILGTEIAPLTVMLIGSVITVYQQFNVHQEDLADGFFDHCRYNGLNNLSYALAKACSVSVTTFLPMALVLIIFGFGLITTPLIITQWIILSVCIACLLTFLPTTSLKTNPLNLLLVWLPMLIAPIIFLIDYLHYHNENSLLIFLGCDIILMCSVFLPFIFNNHKV